MKRVLSILIMVLVFSGCGKSDDPVSSGVDEPVSSPARWTQTPSTIALVAGRQETPLNRVGCFQKIALEHEDGRTFLVFATESAAVPGTVLRLAVSESDNTDKTWAGGAADYTTAAVETIIANGYELEGTPSDSITNLREWSADIRGDYIFIALLYYDAPLTRYQVLRYDITNQTYFELSNSSQGEAQYLNSIDIAISESGPLRDINKRNVGHGSIWWGFQEVDDFDPTVISTVFNRYKMIFSTSPTYNSALQSECTGSISPQGVGGANGYCGQTSLFDGGYSIYSPQCFRPSGSATSDDIYYLRIWHELNEYFYDLVNNNEITPIFLPLSISGAIDQNNLLYDFGTWDACYIDYYNYQVQAKWIRNSTDTGWDLYIGRRGQNGVFAAQLVKTVDYAALGVADIETELENVGTFPEVVLSTDEQGYVYCMFMYPDPTNNAFSGTGLGYLTGDPYTNIEMVTMDGDEIYDPQNLDLQMIWIGYQDATYRSLKHMSTTHRTDSQDYGVPSDRRLWLTVRDSVGDTRIVLYRN